MIIPNKLHLTYNAVMPDGKKFLRTVESNAVYTEILSYSVSKTIRSDKTSVRKGENFGIGVTVSNDSAVKLFNNFFTIPQPVGAGYVAGSVKINGVARPAFDPIKGFPLPDLNPGETVAIEYVLKADDQIATTTTTNLATLNYTVNDPERGNISYSENTDTVSLDVISDIISVTKSVDKSFALKGEILHYTVIIANTGNITKTDMVFKDPVPAGTTFVSYSVKIDRVNYSVYNPEVGFAIRSLAPDEVLTVEFDVKVN